MSELTVLHFTDTEDELDKYQVIKQFAQDKQDSLDAVFFTGDFIGTHVHQPTCQKILEAVNQVIHAHPRQQEFVQNYQPLVRLLEQHGLEIDQWASEEAKNQYHQLFQQVSQISKEIIEENKEELTSTIEDIIDDSYRQIAAEFKDMNLPVFAVNGNQDLTRSYSLFPEKVTFVEKVEGDKATLTGKTGTTFVIKGDLNTWEIPGTYGDYFGPLIPLSGVAEILSPYTIDYNSGFTQETINQKIDQAREQGNEEETQHWIQRGGGMRQYQREQRSRLGSPDEVDIYLTHKLPHNNRARPDSVPSYTGPITSEYSAHASATYGGHFYDGQVGHRSLTKILAQSESNTNTQETTTLDGVEVPVIYLDPDEPWELNPGSEHFFVTEFNPNKEVEAVTIYQYVYD